VVLNYLSFCFWSHFQKSGRESKKYVGIKIADVRYSSRYANLFYTKGETQSMNDVTNSKRKIRRIRRLRKQLEKMLIETDMKVNKEILQMSQRLDILIVEYYQ